VPALNREKPIVQNDTHPQPQVTVAAREPGKAAPGPVAAATPQASGRTLIIAGASLMLFAGILGTWIVFQARSRSRASYISRSMADKP
jgi:hypothetical protein